MILSQTIRLLLDSIGRSEEYEYYLQKFRSDRSAAFAILCPDLDSLERAGDVIRLHLQFLARLDLHPLVLLTGPEAGHMRDLLLKEGEFDLFSPADPSFPSGGSLLSSPDLSSHDEGLKSFCENAKSRGRIGLYMDDRSTLLSALRRIVPLLTGRVHLIRLRGSLHDREERELSHCDAKRPAANIALSDIAVRELTGEILGISRGMHISVTSPYNLLKEIFTVKGAGTVVRLGSSILHFTDSERRYVDEAKLVELLNSSFRKRIRSPSLLDEIRHFYIEEGYRAAALLSDHPAGLYLSKFAVNTDARGEGIAQEIWERMTSDHASLFWRSRRENSINRWYGRLAHGQHTTGKWTIFWRGIRVEDLPQIIRYCESRPEDFETALE